MTKFEQRWVRRAGGWLALARRVVLGWRILSVRGQDVAFSLCLLRCVLIPFCGQPGDWPPGSARPGCGRQKPGLDTRSRPLPCRRSCFDKEGNTTSTDYGLVQIDSSLTGQKVKGADGKQFTITKSITTDWKENARVGAALVAKEYKVAVRDQPHGSAETRAQQAYSGYNGGSGKRKRYTQGGNYHGFADKRDYHSLRNYRAETHNQ